jgi:hypothetical protein
MLISWPVSEFILYAVTLPDEKFAAYTNLPVGSTIMSRGSGELKGDPRTGVSAPVAALIL